MMWRAIGMAGMMVLSAGAQAASLNVALSSDAARFEFQTASSALGLNNADLTYSITYNDANDWLGGARLEVLGDAAAPGSGLHAGGGVSAMLGDTDDQSVLTVGIGGQVRYNFPQANRFAITAQGYFAPKVTSFADSEGYSDWSVQGEYELTREARLFLGYRDIEVKLDGHDDVELERGLYGGLKLIF